MNLARGYTSKEKQRHLSLECQSLRDLVEKLRKELLLCTSETQKVKDQLQCLIYLVRRAWSGDCLAAIHVSNIVGVQPPDLNRNNEARVNVSSILADPVTNWARLCIGVLNKMYGEEELELRASQLMYLQDREGYLDDELASHSDLAQHQSNMSLLKTNTFQLLQAKEEEERKERQERITQLEKQKQEIQLQHRKKHPPHYHLYQKPSRDSIKQEAELNVDDGLFLVKSVGSSTTSGVNRKENNNQTVKYHGHNKESMENECEEIQPKKHTRSFTTDGVVPKLRKPRAKSAVSSNKPCDNATRSRPLSGSLTKTKSTTSSSKKSREYIDPIEGELKMTTKALQDRLGISKQGMV